MSIHWTDPRTSSEPPSRLEWLLVIVIVIAVASTLLLASPREQHLNQMLISADGRRVTLLDTVSDDVVLCASEREAATCARVGDLRRPSPAGRRWVATDEHDRRLTVELAPMPVDWLTCLHGTTRTRCGLAREWDQWIDKWELEHAERAR